MQLTEFFLAELDREAARSRAALEQIPDDEYEWTPHERSMKFGYLSELVAIIPSWIAMQVTQDELDVAPVKGTKAPKEPMTTRAQLRTALDDAVAAARTALAGTTDEHLHTNWRLLARGELAQEAQRYLMIQDTFNHWAHHRGQMTVYLRLLGAKVPSTYGPSADDPSFR
jgi:uncharacterized damage-inducible protein DinB